jgi:hypothetical protein
VSERLDATGFPDPASCCPISQARPSGRCAPVPCPWTAAAGAVAAPTVLALPGHLLSQVLDPLQTSWGHSIPPGEEDKGGPGGAKEPCKRQQALFWGLAQSLGLAVCRIKATRVSTQKIESQEFTQVLGYTSSM